MVSYLETKQSEMKMTSKKTEANAGTSAGIGRAKDNTNQLSNAVTTGSKAYVDGIVALGRAFGDYRREILDEATRHVRATVSAKSLREVGELQAAWVQQRVETSTAHTKEIADLARTQTKAVIAPFTALLDRQKKA